MPVQVDGRYRLDRLISAQPGIEDWQATDMRLGRPVALRLIRGATRQRLDELARAATRLSRIEDDRLARVFDLDVSAEPAFVVTEWVQGPTLSTLLTTTGVDPGLAVELIAETAAALAAAADAGLHHLHLTADSIVISDSGLVKVVGTGLDSALDRGTPRHAAAARADTLTLGRILALAVRRDSMSAELQSVLGRTTGDARTPTSTPAELAEALEPCRDSELSLRRDPVRPAAVDAPHRLASRRVRDLMETAVVTVSEDTPVLELAEILARAQCSVVPVVDRDGHVTGLISSTDLARWRVASV